MKKHRKILCLILSFTLVLLSAVYCFADSNSTVQTGIPIIRTQRYSLFGALYRAQGIASDSTNLYFGSNQFVFSFSNITKTSLNGKLIRANLNAIPFKAKLDLCNHVGGIDFADGFIWAGIEDNIERKGHKYNNPYVAVYDAETTKLVRYKKLPLALRVSQDNGDGIITADECKLIYSKQDYNEQTDIRMHTDGIPWVVADTERGYFYSAEWSNAKYINVFDIETFEFVKLIEIVDGNGNPYSYTDPDGNISEGLHRCQGADMFEGKLFCSTDIGESHPVITLDFDKIEGKAVADVLFERNLGDCECEDGTVYKNSDRIIYATNYIDGITVYVRYYDISSLV